MKKIEVYLDEPLIAEEKSDFELKIVGVYQDAVTQSWLAPVCRKATQLAGEERVRNTWYDVNSLTDAGIFREAVHATLMADVIMVAVYAADELPLNLYVWIDAWLPRRPAREGVLTALIGIDEPRPTQSLHTHRYLEAVARKARLDFIPQARQRLIPSRDRPNGHVSGGAPARQGLIHEQEAGAFGAGPHSEQEYFPGFL